MRKKSAYAYLLSGLMSMSSIGYSNNIDSGVDSGELIKIPANYTLHEQVLDPDFDKELTRKTYHKEQLDNLLSTDTGFLWLQSTAGKNWLVSSVGHNWFVSDSLVVNRWLDTEDAKSWVLTDKGQQSMTVKVNSLSDEKELNLHSVDAKWWPSFASIVAYGAAGVGGVAGYKYYDGGVKQKLTAGAAMAIAGLAALKLTQSLVNACTSFQSALDKVFITKAGQQWLYTESGIKWLVSPQGSQWLMDSEGQDRLSLLEGNKNGHSVAKGIIHNGNPNKINQVVQQMEQVLLNKVNKTNAISGYWYASDLDQFLSTYVGGLWLVSSTGVSWLQTYNGSEWQVDAKGKMRSIFKEWLNKDSTVEGIKTNADLQKIILEHIEAMDNHDDSKNWYYDSELSQFISSKAAGMWLTTDVGKQWMKDNSNWQNWLKSARNGWLWEHSVIKWLNTQAAVEWIQSNDAKTQFETILNQWNAEKCKDGWIYNSSCSAVKNTKAGKLYLKSQAKK
ncbi:hypothetical protein [Cysteiniphilum halobium]|uniref:hypothetical protein n=1 Tax=Cysteiniphilum halobium TaxID=2219059 RepID=UPI000E652AB6|nr:hypothetical protein [Cysteiniphilum halobium]